MDSTSERCISIEFSIATAYAKEGQSIIKEINITKLEKAKRELEKTYGIQVLVL